MSILAFLVEIGREEDFDFIASQLQDHEIAVDGRSDSIKPGKEKYFIFYL